MMIRARDLFASWGKVLRGKTPLLSIEITSQCPLKCPGCYAYGDAHIANGAGLRTMREFRGDELVSRVLSLVERHDPLHVSLVGGEPLMRRAELDRLLPELSRRRIVTLVVTSGVIPVPPAWGALPRVVIAVSVDGLPRDHDVRRAPATYERILHNIDGCPVHVHWTITRPQAERPDDLEAYVAFWSARPEVERILVSLYSPQRQEQSDEMPTLENRRDLASRLSGLARGYPKLLAPDCVTAAFVDPPANPAACLYARISANYTADLATCVEPCVLGGDPDCSQCGCAIGTALHGIAGLKLAGPIRVGHLIAASLATARVVNGAKRVFGAHSPSN